MCSLSECESQLCLHASPSYTGVYTSYHELACDVRRMEVAPPIELSENTQFDGSCLSNVTWDYFTCSCSTLFEDLHSCTHLALGLTAHLGDSQLPRDTGFLEENSSLKNSSFCHRRSFGSLPLSPLACSVGDT